MLDIHLRRQKQQEIIMYDNLIRYSYSPDGATYTRIGLAKVLRQLKF